MSKQKLRGLFWFALVILLVSISDNVANAKAALVLASFMAGWQLAFCFGDGDDK